MSKLQELELIDRLRRDAAEGGFEDFYEILSDLERAVRRVDQNAQAHRKRAIWARVWTSPTPAHERPVWFSIEDEIEVVTLTAGDPDNLDRLCSSMVVAAQEMLSEQPDDVQAVRLRVLLATHDANGKAHRLPLDYVARRESETVAHSSVHARSSVSA